MVRQKPAKLLSPVRIWVSPFLLKGVCTGRIFGISKLPVSILDKALAPCQELIKPVHRYTTIQKLNNSSTLIKKDTFVKTNTHKPTTKHK